MQRDYRCMFADRYRRSDTAGTVNIIPMDVNLDTKNLKTSSSSQQLCHTWAVICTLGLQKVCIKKITNEDETWMEFWLRDSSSLQQIFWSTFVHFENTQLKTSSFLKHRRNLKKNRTWYNRNYRIRLKSAETIIGQPV